MADEIFGVGGKPDRTREIHHRQRFGCHNDWSEASLARVRSVVDVSRNVSVVSLAVNVGDGVGWFGPTHDRHPGTVVAFATKRILVKTEKTESNDVSSTRELNRNESMCADGSRPMRLESKPKQYQTKPERDTPMAAKKKAPAKKKAAAKKAPAKKKAAAKKK